MRALLLVLAVLSTSSSHADVSLTAIPSPADLAQFLKQHRDNHGDVYTDEQISRMSAYASDVMQSKLKICKELLPKYPQSADLNCERVIVQTSDLNSKYALFRQMNEVHVPLAIASGLRELASRENQEALNRAKAVLERGVGGHSENGSLSPKSVEYSLGVFLNFAYLEQEYRTAWSRTTGDIRPEDYFPSRADLEFLMRFRNEADLTYEDAAKRGWVKDSDEIVANTSDFAVKSLARQLEICEGAKSKYSHTKDFNCKELVAYGSDLLTRGMNTFRDILLTLSNPSLRAPAKSKLAKDRSYERELTESKKILSLGLGKKDPRSQRSGQALTESDLQRAMVNVICLTWLYEQF